MDKGNCTHADNIHSDKRWRQSTEDAPEAQN